MAVSMAGAVRTGADGRFYYVDEEGNERRLNLWVQGKRLHIADMDLVDEYSIEGEFSAIRQIPTSVKK